MEKFLTVLLHVLPCSGMGRGNGLYLVSGRVLALDGPPFPAGANVTAKGCNTRVSTNRDGEFSLYLQEVPALLVFDSKGFVSQEIAVVPPLESPQLLAATNCRFKDLGPLKNNKR